MQAFLRHALATLAYRGGKTVRNAPAEFSSFQAGPSSRTAGQSSRTSATCSSGACHSRGASSAGRTPRRRRGRQDVARFHAGLAAFDGYLASGAPLACTPEKLFQGPIADALTHVGQIGMLWRLAGSPVKGENYFRADIEIGRVEANQTTPKREF